MKKNSTKIFITGGTGFIGKHLLEELNIASYELFVLSRVKISHEPPSGSTGIIKYIPGDIFALDKYSSILSECDFFVHIAGEKHDEKEMFKVNVEGMTYIINVLVKYPKIKLIYISSTGVYGLGNQKEENITEALPCFPNNTYEKTKFQAERILKENGSKFHLNYIILRPSNVFGEFDKGKKLLNLIRSLKQNRFCYIGNDAKVNYLYVKQLTVTIHEFIKQDTFANTIYNINSPCSICEFVEAIKKSLGINKKTIVLPIFIRLFIYFALPIFNLLPTRYQILNRPKYRELTNKKIFSNEKIKKIIPSYDDRMLFTGLNNLISYYSKEGLI